MESHDKLFATMEYNENTCVSCRHNYTIIAKIRLIADVIYVIRVSALIFSLNNIILVSLQESKI
jgi:hypothetical protein